MAQRRLNAVSLRSSQSLENPRESMNKCSNTLKVGKETKIDKLKNNNEPLAIGSLTAQDTTEFIIAKDEGRRDGRHGANPH